MDVPDFATGSVMEKMGIRKGTLVSMNPFNGRTKLESVSYTHLDVYKRQASS